MKIIGQTFAWNMMFDINYSKYFCYDLSLNFFLVEIIDTADLTTH